MFFRFGPDYYAKLASSPSGTKAKSPKSPEVSLSDGNINEIEATAVYSSLPRTLYTSKNSSRNFVKNPLLNFPELNNF